jgi:hypothetical protein
MMTETKELPPDFIAQRARSKWAAGRSKGVLATLFRLLGTSRPIEVIYIAEYVTGDWEEAQCRGNPVRVWAFRGGEFESIEAIGTLDRSNPICSATPIIRFWMSTDGQSMVFNSWNGFRAGYGHILLKEGSHWRSQGRKWVS